MEDRTPKLFRRVEKLPDTACIALGFALFLLILLLCGCSTVERLEYCPVHTTTEVALVGVGEANDLGWPGGVRMFQGQGGTYTVRAFFCPQCPKLVYTTNYID